MKLKVIEVNVKSCDDYVTVTDVYENMRVEHHTMLRNTPKHDYPFVLFRQTLPPYKYIVVRLDKLGLTKKTPRQNILIISTKVVLIMIDIKDSRIRLCTIYEDKGKKKAVIQVQLTPHPQETQGLYSHGVP